MTAMADNDNQIDLLAAKTMEEKGSPLYQKVRAQLKQQIDRGFWKPGDMLPTEPELGEQFGVSAGTVKQALLSLAREGLIIRRAGKGTFVARLDGSRSFARFFRFRDAPSGENLDPKIRVVETRMLRSAPREITEGLQISSAAPVVFLRRMLMQEDVPICLYDSYLPRDLVPNLDKVPLDEDRLYRALEKHFGIHVVNADEVLRAGAASGSEAKLLSLPEGAPVILIERTAFTHGGRIIEVRRTIGRSDRFFYRIRLP
jgi:GntR family transcriptional regulator